MIKPDTSTIGGITATSYDFAEVTAGDISSSWNKPFRIFGEHKWFPLVHKYLTKELGLSIKCSGDLYLSGGGLDAVVSIGIHSSNKIFLSVPIAKKRSSYSNLKII